MKQSEVSFVLLHLKWPFLQLKKLLLHHKQLKINKLCYDTRIYNRQYGIYSTSFSAQTRACYIINREMKYNKSFIMAIICCYIKNKKKTFCSIRNEINTAHHPVFVYFFLRKNCKSCKIRNSAEKCLCNVQKCWLLFIQRHAIITGVTCFGFTTETKNWSFETCNVLLAETATCIHISHTANKNPRQSGLAKCNTYIHTYKIRR